MAKCERCGGEIKTEFQLCKKSGGFCVEIDNPIERRIKEEQKDWDKPITEDE